MNIAAYLKSHAPILQVVSEYITLKKLSPSNHVGLCPFHQEATPSLSVNPNRGSFRCYGCGKSGDSIKFVQEINQCTFMEAMKIMVESFNIPQPESLRKKMIRRQIREYESDKQLDKAKELMLQL